MVLYLTKAKPPFPEFKMGFLITFHENLSGYEVIPKYTF